MDIVALVGVNAWRLRKGAGLTRDELAAKSGVSPAAIKRLEEMKNDTKVTTLALLAEALEVDITEFFKEASSLEDPLEKSRRYELNHKVRTALYPEQPGEYHIYSLRLFLLYLPLLNRHELADSLSRIHGQCFGYEIYLLDQMERLYNTVQPAPVKVFADTMADLDKPENQRCDGTSIPNMEAEVFEEGREAYTKKLHEFLKFIDETFQYEVRDDYLF